MRKNVYITATSSYFPNEKVVNDDMELYLGKLGDKPSRLKNIVLRQNGIKSRYYALDKNQQITHTNAEMAAQAINGLFASEEEKNKTRLLSFGTSTPDQWLPSQAAMVHGETFKYPMEIFSAAGVCLTSLNALKVAYMVVAGGWCDNAVSANSELVSPVLLSKLFEKEYDCIAEVAANPILAFEKDFLRFMLSDGAAAVHLQPEKHGDKNLLIDWIEMVSYAGELPACMYMGAEGMPDKSIRSWKNYTADEIGSMSLWAIKQDVKLLNEFAIARFVDAIERAISLHDVDLNKIRYVIPHISSMFFYKKLEDEINARGINLPESKWYTNLTWVGNVGSVAPVAALDELLRTMPIEPGDQIMLLVPESGRFSYGVALLTFEGK